MRKANFICVFALINFTICLSQEISVDSINLFIEIQNEPFPGVGIYIEDLEIQEATTTDFHGRALLHLPRDKNEIRLSFLGPIVRLKIFRPTDSISINLDKKRAVFFYQGRRTKKKKLSFSGY